MPDPVPVLTRSCQYLCVDGLWVFIGGSAPDGYHCPHIAGGCDNYQLTYSIQPVPNNSPPVPDAEAPLATYTFDRSSKLLTFNNGAPTEGFGFANQLSLEECMKFYPELAPKFQEIQASLDLSGLKLELPGLPIQKIAEWYKSKSTKGLA